LSSGDVTLSIVWRTKCDIEAKHYQKEIRWPIRGLFWVWDQSQRGNELSGTFRVILINVKFVTRDNGLVLYRPAVKKAHLVPRLALRPAIGGRDGHH